MKDMVVLGIRRNNFYRHGVVIFGDDYPAKNKSSSYRFYKKYAKRKNRQIIKSHIKTEIESYEKDS